jgi:hypothetical protein
MMEVEHGFLTYDISIFLVSVDCVLITLAFRDNSRVTSQTVEGNKAHVEVWKSVRGRRSLFLLMPALTIRRRTFFGREAEYSSPSFSVVTWPLAQLPARVVVERCGRC